MADGPEAGMLWKARCWNIRVPGLTVRCLSARANVRGKRATALQHTHRAKLRKAHDVQALDTNRFMQNKRSTWKPFRLHKARCANRTSTASAVPLLPCLQALPLLYTLVGALDPALAIHLQTFAGGAVGELVQKGLTTWFSECVMEVEVAARLMEVFLASHPLMPVYMAAVALADVGQHLMTCRVSLVMDREQGWLDHNAVISALPVWLLSKHLQTSMQARAAEESMTVLEAGVACTRLAGEAAPGSGFEQAWHDATHAHAWQVAKCFVPGAYPSTCIACRIRLSWRTS